jgi:VCBS repeat-containing protein
VPASVGELAVGTFNVENLDPGDGAAKFSTLAGLIVANLKSPDILAVEEVQDNNGAVNDGTVDATTTYNTLIAAIQSAGGPTYQFRQINPVNNGDGGEPGGNIRQGFLFRTDRGLSFVDRPGGTSTGSTSVVSGAGGPELSFSPGRVDPTNTAFNSSRKPLAGEFQFGGEKVFVIANHFNSKGGDQPLFGHFQPPTLGSEVQRTQQAQIVNSFVDSILALDANANVVVAGDLNDFEFSNPLNALKGGVLTDLIETLPQNERYSYVFEGNSQTLDHILVSNNLAGGSFAFDVLHINAEFADQASDHDPSVARFTLETVNNAPTADDDSYSTSEDTALTVPAAQGVLGNDSDVDGDALTAVLVGGPAHGSLTLNADGSFTYTPAADYNGPDSFTYRANDGTASSNTATVTLTTTPVNDPPTAVGNSYSTSEDTALTVPAAQGVLGNDSDVDGDALTAVLVGGPAHGSLTLNADGSFTYTPAADYNGPDSFTYRANDGTASSNTATVTLTITPVNDPPTVAVAAGGSCGTSSLAGTMNVTVADAEGSSVALTGSSSNTSVVPNSGIVFGGSGASRTITITPASKAKGTAVITITASDGQGTSTVTITVIVGAERKDTLNGTSGADLIFGISGSATTNAGAGNDLVCDGNGSGVINGGAGDDTLVGGNGDDQIRGGDGNDALFGGAGADRLEGQNDNDVLTGGTGPDSYSGGPGTDAAIGFNPAEGDTTDGTIP